MKWIGVDGIQRTLTGGACNTHIPTLANQTNIITEKNSLPIVKVLYGPLVHEAQSAKIFIGPIICEPKPLDDWSQINLETRIEKLKKFHEKPICLDEGYKIIFDVCYFFENNKKKFVDAILNCREKVPGHMGKLYEPTNVTTFKEVQSEARMIFGGNYYVWTGFTKIDNAGNLKHSSNGLQLYGEKTFEKLGQTCCLTDGLHQSSIAILSDGDRWEDLPPTSLQRSICVIG